MLNYHLQNKFTTKRDSAIKWLLLVLLGCAMSFFTSLLVRMVMVDSQRIVNSFPTINASRDYSQSIPVRLGDASMPHSLQNKSADKFFPARPSAQEHVQGGSLLDHKSEVRTNKDSLVVSITPIEPVMPERSTLPAFFVPSEKYRSSNKIELDAQPFEVKLQGNSFSSDEPVLIKKVVPAYPSRAKKKGIEGFVVVTFAIQSNGRVHHASVAESNPSGVFDDAALKAVRQFTFKPYAVNQHAARIFSTKILFGRDNQS